MNDRIWAVDVEGSGGTPAEIVELAIVEIWNLRLTGLTRCWRVRPSGCISPFATRIHGIRDCDVENAPAFEEVSDDIHNWIGDGAIAGHNVRVEVGLIGRNLKNWDPAAAYDTLKLARTLMPEAEKHGLQPLGINLELDHAARDATIAAPHSALFDATLCGMILLNLLGRLPSESRAGVLDEIDILSSKQENLL